MASPADPFTPGQAERVRRLRTDFSRMLMHHQFAIDEMLTKVSILREEFLHLHRYNPIEHIKTRIKTAESIVKKLRRYGYETSMDNMVRYVN